jgi:sugar transferase EpsL
MQAEKARTVNARNAHPMQRRAKRLIDVVVAVLALVVTSPIMAAEAIAIWRTMGRPILFRQTRPGRNEVSFEVVKFRSMLPELDQNGLPRSKAQRVTRLGWLLRRTSLDELPQLWSVLKGDLSLVGPRPLLVEYLPYYTERERLRHTVPPGITGLAQVSGRNLLTWAERLELDVQYVENWSLWWDFRIIATTFLRVMRSSGVARDPELEGSLHRVRQAEQQLAGPELPPDEPAAALVPEFMSARAHQHVQIAGER